MKSLICIVLLLIFAVSSLHAQHDSMYIHLRDRHEAIIPLAKLDSIGFYSYSSPVASIHYMDIHQLGKDVERWPTSIIDSIVFIRPTIAGSMRTITFLKNDNQATGTMASVSAPEGTVITLPICAYQNGDKWFCGWRISPQGQGVYANSAKIKVGKTNITLYARWALFDDWKSVLYSKNWSSGGEIDILDEIEPIYLVGDKVILLGPGTLYKNNHTFGGWRLDNTTSIYQPGGSYTIPNSAGTYTIFHAEWLPEPKYSVTYNGNGHTSGNAPSDGNMYWPGEQITVAGSGNMTRPGYTFQGWTLNANGNDAIYTQGKKLTMPSSNLTLYAKWQQNAHHRVFYNGSGSTSGSVPVDNNQYQTGSNVTVAANTGNLVKMHNKISMRFIGWNTAANGSGTTYQPGQKFNIGSADITLYAQWTVIGGIGPAGGLVFYDKGSYSHYQYLEVIPESYEGIAHWGGYGTQVNCPSLEVGHGFGNTSIIVYYLATTSYYAARACKGITFIRNGIVYDNWFLPTRGELHLMYQNLHAQGLGNFQNQIYWSSSEGDANFAHVFNFSIGHWQYYTKNNTYRYRAIRMF